VEIHNVINNPFSQPIVDGGLVADPFLPDEPLELIRRGKYCLIDIEKNIIEKKITKKNTY
jgi:hypothetical protein